MLVIQKDISLLSYNTFQIDVKAKYFVEISTIEELNELFAMDVFKQEKKQILGGGANILFTGDFEGLVIKVNIKGKKVEGEKENQVFVKVAAGENWSDFVDYANACGWAGIENLIAIPGNVGTAPISNIGAYGVEIGDYVVGVEGYDLQTRMFKQFSHDECKFAYRSSIFKYDLRNQFLVTHVVFALKQFDENYSFNLNYPDVQKQLKSIQQPLSLSSVSQIISEIRTSKLPDHTKIGTAGSFFANPIVDQEQYKDLIKHYSQLISYPAPHGIKLSAGQLIDLAGLKGYSNGKAGTSPQHALIVTNQGGTAQDVLEVVDYIQAEILAKFGVDLIPEVVYV